MFEKLPPAEPGSARGLDTLIAEQLKAITDPYRKRRRQVGLFSGADSESKALAARVVGARIGFDPYRVDLSSIVSKYIGETEKNLTRIFTAADEMRATLLLLDEADALFGKRGEAEDAHDRYANQATNYFLQRLEDFEGLVILAANSRDNLDDALLRRLDWTVEFPAAARRQPASLWANIRRRLRSFFAAN